MPQHGASPSSETRTLFKICRTGTVSQLSSHLRRHPLSNPPPRTPSDDTPLHLVAAQNRDPSPLLDCLITQSHPPNLRGHLTHNRTALHEAARRTDSAGPQAIATLLKHGAFVDAVKKGDWTPLMVAASAANAHSMATLVRFGANVRLRNGVGATALHVACRCGCVEGVKLLLDVDGGAVNGRTLNGRTPLHYAARAGHVAVVGMLLEGGARVEAVDKGGMCAGHEACGGGRVGALRELVRVAGGWRAVWSGDCGGLTGLHHAAVTGGLGVGQVMLEGAAMSGEGVDQRDGRGFTALFLAIWHGREELARAILKGGGLIGERWVERLRGMGRTRGLELVIRLGGEGGGERAVG